MTGDSHDDDVPEPAVNPAATGDRPLHEMQLRPSRAPVTRLSRKVLLGLAVIAAAGVATALFLALRPNRTGPASELYNTDSHSTPDGLANLPHDYTQLPRSVPQLGPPLPGDLGRAIVSSGAPAPPMGTQTAVTAQQQQIVQEQDAARVSKLFATSDAGQAAGDTEQAAIPNFQLPLNKTAAGAAGSMASGALTGDLASQDHKLAFLNQPTDDQTVSTDRLAAPASPYVVQAGSVISAALLTGLRSDLPGQVTAQVTENVYDSPTGTILLIPQGARLVGQYDAQVSFGQSRALLVWNRLIMPNGRSIILPRQPGADPQGYAGLQDQVDNHWGMLFKAAILSTLLSVGTEAGTSDDENSLAQALRQGASQSFNQVGEQVVGRSLNVQPTITVRPGFEVRVMVTQDLVLEPYAG